ncbi:hypothetical protein STRCR_2129 [Streptococcus criceti HS-6]|uniref:Uncharacterized protein n=1 Tax=Streptococcus criceti HS-6 TaxID=873449 RepID=G5JS49_STRCG|nr:hypothetical protein STRCR_2129 [Streptococcus criceti HS-6]
MKKPERQGFSFEKIFSFKLKSDMIGKNCEKLNKLMLLSR